MSKNYDEIERAFRMLSEVVKKQLTRQEMEAIKAFAEQLVGATNRALAKGPVKG